MTLPGRSRAKGPITAPLSDARALEMAEAADLDPVVDLDARARRRHWGQTVTSRPSLVSKLNQTVAGVDQGRALLHGVRARRRACKAASAAASSARLLMPSSSSAGASSATAPSPSAWASATMSVR